MVWTNKAGNSKSLSILLVEPQPHMVAVGVWVSGSVWVIWLFFGER